MNKFTNIFAFSSILLMSLLLIEAFTYSGFLFKNILISPTILLYLCFFLGLHQILLEKKYFHEEVDTKLSYSRILFKVNNLLFLPLLIFSNILKIVEESHYHNYVFSNYHIQVAGLDRAVIYSAFLVFLYLANSINFVGIRNHLQGYIKIKTQSIFSIRSDSLLKLALVTALFVYGFSIFNFGFSYVITNGLKIVKIGIFSDPDTRYEVKMLDTYGDFYSFTKLIKKYTPETASIVLPPQRNPWQLEGNQRLMRYFLYPRTLYLPQILDDIHLEADYVLIAWGNSAFPPVDDNGYGWPKVKLESENIYYFDLKNLNVTKSDTSLYVPEDPKNTYAYGLIELLKK